MDFRYRGRRIRRPSPDGTRRGAETLERSLRKEFVDDEDAGRDPFAGPPPTLAEFSERWMRDYVVPNNRPSGQREKAMTLRVHLLPPLGALRLDQITTATIDAFKAQKAASGLAPKSVNNILSVLRCALTSAVEWNLLRVVPKVHWLKVPSQGYRYLVAEEADRLLGATRPGLWRVLILFLLRTGTRFGEAAALRWEDLELTVREPVVHVRRGVDRGVVGPTKTGRARDVPLTPDLVAALRDFQHERPYVFSRFDGGFLRPDSNGKQLDIICRRAGLRHISWHALRHTFATELTAKGVPIRVVQELLGHTTIAMTSRYAHVAPSTLRESILKLAAQSSAPDANGTLMVTTAESRLEWNPKEARVAA